MAKRFMIMALAVFFGFQAAAALAAQNMEAEIRAVLKEHPEILLEALTKEKGALLGILEDAARERQQAEENKRIEEEMKNPLKPVLESGRMFMGKADAPVVVVEYSDFFCHYCAAGAATMKELATKRPDVKVVFKHFANSPVSQTAALMFEALALQKPELALAFHDAVFANQQKLAEGGEAALKELAVSLGADPARLDADMKRPELAERLKKDLEEARNFKFRGTPTYVVGGISVRGAAPLPVFEDAVNRALQNAKAGTAPAATKDKDAAAKAKDGQSKDKKECTDCREIQ